MEFMIKNYIRNKIELLVLWAIGERLERMKEATGKNYQRFLTLQREQDKLRKNLQNACDVAVDHHIREGESWAVICTRKPNGHERVNFYRLPNDSVEALHRIVHDYSRDKVFIDSHPLIYNKNLFL